MTRGVRVLGAAVGFVTGSVIGWFAHDELENNRSDSLIAKLRLLAGVESFKSSPWDNNWDRRNPKSLIKPSKSSQENGESSEEAIKKLTPKASRHLFLIRHGQYNEKGSSDETRMLTALGWEQADLTGRRLSELNHPYTILVHSTMKRAIETASAIKKNFPDLKVDQSDLLREGCPWPPEPPSKNWRPEAAFFQDNARIEAAFRKYFHRADPKQTEDSFEIIVCHANVIRYFVCRALQLPPEAWLRMSLYHGSITWVTIRPNGGVSLRCLGDAGHMPSDKLSVV